jgi:hypothetical protein
MKGVSTQLLEWTMDLYMSIGQVYLYLYVQINNRLQGQGTYRTVISYIQAVDTLYAIE